MRIISGGQTGADMAGLRAAAKLGLETGGYAPRGYITEIGPQPVKLKNYGLIEIASGYAARTQLNIEHSDMTLIIAHDGKLEGGSALTRDLCFKLHKPVFHIALSDLNTYEHQIFDNINDVRDWILPRPHDVINVAGNRESKAPGIQYDAERFLIRLLQSVR